MAVIKVPTTFNIDVEFEVPEFYRRMIALIIDSLIIVFYYIIALWIVNYIVSGSEWDENMWYNIWALKLLIAVLPVLSYHFIMELTMNGQSPGKKILGIRVVHENGGRASLSQFAIRWLLRDIWLFMLLSFTMYMAAQGFNVEAIVMILLLVGLFITDIILVVSSKKGQRLGDILAHTILIKTGSNTRIEETVFMEVADNYVPTYPQIMQLNDKDINAIKSILETARKKGDFNMAAQASEKIKSHLQIDSNVSPFDFLDLLLRDYNYLSTK